MRPELDHDRLFKELIRTFFFEFVDLFFPSLAAKLDRNELEFLDKELFTDVTEGERHEVDLVAKVRLDGQPSFFLFHVEPQSSARSDFARRMFTYFARLHESFGLPVFPVAVLSYDQPKAEAPREYAVEIDAWRVLTFSYQALQLNRMAWRDYIRNDNPISLALAAKMDMRPAERRKVKFECLRLLWTMRLDPARMEMITGFIDSYLALNQEEERWVEEEMAIAIPERKPEKVLFWTHWHDRGFDKGLVEGVEQGSKQTAIRVFDRIWRKRFGTDVPETLATTMKTLDSSRLEQMSEAVLDFQSPADAETWLAEHPAV